MKTIMLSERELYRGNLIVVNAAHPYHEEASDARLRPVLQEAQDILLEEHALLRLSALMDEIGGWEEIVPVSGWRSFEEQRNIFDASVRENGEKFTRKFVALPGCSEHQTGLAIDLALKKEEVDFICPDFPYEGICRRFRERAEAYGFVERYQEDKKYITGIAREPWHFRYVGAPHARIMKEQRLCLEEYAAFLKKFPYGERYYCRQMGRQKIRISYLAADGKHTGFEAGDGDFCEISGNNMDGYIITERRKM